MNLYSKVTLAAAWGKDWRLGKHVSGKAWRKATAVFGARTRVWTGGDWGEEKWASPEMWRAHLKGFSHGLNMGSAREGSAGVNSGFYCVYICVSILELP